MADEQEYPGNELTNEQAAKLRDAAVAFLLRGLDPEIEEDGKFVINVASMECVLKVLDFVTG